jgi:aspartate-semialdehyde dehydrogenase
VGWNVGVVGATGAVGQVLLQVLQERAFPVERLRLFASARTAGQRVRFQDSDVSVEAVTPGCFRGLDFCFLAVPGSQVSRELAPEAARAGATVIDKGSAFRLEPDVPLVVPEVNPAAARAHRGIVASPNCTTIPLVMCLAPLARLAGLRRVVVATYQSASGSGRVGMEALRRESAAVLAGEAVAAAAFPRRLAFNVIPQCDRFAEAAFTLEEWKLTRESRKVLDQPDLALTATAVRVPVFVAHSEAVFVETEEPLSPEQARAALAQAPGVRLEDDPASARYPTAAEVAGSDWAHVGRVRQAPGDARALHFWVVGDNLRKGAATNAVQIAELLARG